MPTDLQAFKRFRQRGARRYDSDRRKAGAGLITPHMALRTINDRFLQERGAWRRNGEWTAKPAAAHCRHWRIRRWYPSAGASSEDLPFHLGAAFVVILHINPETESQLATVLALHTAMPVVAVTGSMPLMADRVYVIPPDRQLEISDNEIAAVPFEEPRGHRAPIDTFFRSLATQKGDGFAVILSGGGSDGAVGIKAVKEAGG